MPAQDQTGVSGSPTDRVSTLQATRDGFKSPPRLSGCHVVLGYTRSGFFPSITLNLKLRPTTA
jgi:hypothetical protein